MAEFQLDTSGRVTRAQTRGRGIEYIFWSDLDPFTAGYIEALLRDAPAVGALSGDLRFPRFSDLAPETLARIMADCAMWCAEYDPGTTPTPAMGRLFWEIRQDGRRRTFPPLTPHLGDNGRVYLREAAQ